MSVRKTTTGLTTRKRPSGAAQLSEPSRADGTSSSSKSVILADLMINDRHVPRVGSLIYNRVFVKGLPAGTSLCDIHRTFSQYGQVIETKLIVDRNGHSKGYGFVSFSNTDDALNVLRQKDSVFVNEKQVIVGPAVRKPSRRYQHASHRHIRRSAGQLPFSSTTGSVPEPRVETGNYQVLLLNAFIPTNQYYLGSTVPMTSLSISNSLSNDGSINESDKCAYCMMSLCSEAQDPLPRNESGHGITRNPTTVVSPFELCDVSAASHQPIALLASSSSSSDSSTYNLYCSQPDHCCCCSDETAKAQQSIVAPALLYDQSYSAYSTCSQQTNFSSSLQQNAIISYHQQSPDGYYSFGLADYTPLFQQPITGIDQPTINLHASLLPVYLTTIPVFQ